MLTIQDLLTQNTKPFISDVSLALYKKFYEDHLLKMRFSYVLPDCNVLNVLFEPLGLFHLLGIHHIDSNMQARNFNSDIDNGLDFPNFRNHVDLAVRDGFNMMKNRIKMFACTCYAMKTGRLFEVPSGIVKGTQTVTADYIIYCNIMGEGMNIPLRIDSKQKQNDSTKLIPVSILADKKKYLMKHIDQAKEKNINRLNITEVKKEILKFQV